jgi:hypothetical protein
MSLYHLLSPGPQVNDMVMPGSLRREHPVDSGPAIGLGLGVKTALNSEL